MIPQQSRTGEWSWLSEDLANVSLDRTGQDRAGREKNEEGTGYYLGLSLSDILVDCTRVLARPICPRGTEGGSAVDHKGSKTVFPPS